MLYKDIIQKMGENKTTEERLGAPATDWCENRSKQVLPSEGRQEKMNWTRKGG